MIATFFGHRDTPQRVDQTLRIILMDLITNKGVDLFYVGNQGEFDRMVINNLKLLKPCFPQIKFYVVLAYMPCDKEGFKLKEGEETVFPDILEKTPPKYAIAKRNLWMIEKSDYVVTYVKHITGGAAQYQEIAEKKGRIVINLAYLGV